MKVVCEDCRTDAEVANKSDAEVWLHKHAQVCDRHAMHQPGDEGTPGEELQNHRWTCECCGAKYSMKPGSRIYRKDVDPWHYEVRWVRCYAKCRWCGHMQYVRRELP